MNNNVRRLGLVVPPGNVAMERELAAYLPSDVVMNVNRLSRPTAEVSPESLTAMNAYLEQAAKDLSMCYPQPSVILYGCSSGGFILGPDKERSWINSVEQACGMPIVSTASAVVDAIRHLSASTVYLVTPYVDAVNTHVEQFLAASGIKMRDISSFRIPDTRDVAKIPSEEVTALIKKDQDKIKDVDLIFISCTNLLTMDQIATIENSLGLPVLTSNQCSLWGALRRMNARSGARAPGRLFDGMREQPTLQNEDSTRQDHISA